MTIRNLNTPTGMVQTETTCDRCGLQQLTAPAIIVKRQPKPPAGWMTMVRHGTGQSGLDVRRHHCPKCARFILQALREL